MLYRPTASKEMVDCYKWAAWLATRRRSHVVAWDKYEAKQWGKVASYCEMMAGARFVDAPDSKVDYEIPMDPDMLQQRIAQEVLRDYNDVIDRAEDEDIRRPMPLEKRMALAAAMRILSAHERMVAQMVYAWRLPKDLVAEALDVEYQTVERYLRRLQQKWAAIRGEFQ